MKRLVVLGGGESGVGTALLGKQKGYEDCSTILDCRNFISGIYHSNIEVKINEKISCAWWRRKWCRNSTFREAKRI